jgi:hypothetical protein
METPIWVLRRAQNRAGAVLLPMLLLVCSAVLLALPGASARAASLNLRQPLSAGVAHTRPGIPSAAASPQAVAGELAQVTGLTPSQVAAANVCPTPSPGTAQCLAQAVVLRSTHARVHPHVHTGATFTQVFPRHRAGQATPGGAVPASGSGATAPPTASTPAYLQQAYDLTYLSQTAGGSDTVAIVDAYNDPNAESDLAHFRSNYGLSACTTGNGCFKKVNENGQASPLPSGDLGWEEEESLDLDAVSSLCPNCHITLVEANSNFNSDLYAAIASAESLGANQISNSWGGTSSVPFGASSYPGQTVIASTGDHGYPGAGLDNYPAAMPGVTAAGGTSLSAATTSTSLRGYGESAWSLSGGWGGASGCDLNVPKPSYQTDTGCAGRSWSDLSADADPYTGLTIYDSGNGGWIQMGGTSLSSPLIAAYEAVTSVNGTSPQWAYSDSAMLNDPVTGQTGSCAAAIAYICNAGTGYDGPTGVGSVSGAVANGAPGVGGPAVGTGYNNTYALTVGATVASLTGGVYPNGLDTTYHWQYGTTTSYGQQAPATDAGAGRAPVAAPANLTGLTASTVYHYRLVAQNSAGTTYGYDYSFTSASAGSIPPANTAPPVISGTAQQGQTLTTSSGTWNPTPTSYGYQWQRSADGGSTWANIAGATSSSYTPVAADVGDQLQAVVTAGNQFGSATVTAAAVGPVASGAPRNTVAPRISGTPEQGQVLNVNSTWNPAGTSYAYQWQRSPDGTTWANIAGATGSSYALAPADEGDSVRAVVTATNPYGQVTATSPAVGPVQSNPPVNTVAPTVTGTTQRTYTLTATQGTWSGPNNTYSYQWQRSADGTNWTNIAGATNAQYVLGTGDEGDVVRMLVSASNLDGFVIAASQPTLLISPYPAANIVAPTISGTPTRTYTLTATQGSWTGPDNQYGYQWQRDFGEGFVNIAGATGSSYTLAVADEGAVVRVVVSAANPDGTIVQASQPTTTVQAAVPVNQTLPLVVGTAQRSSTLTATVGTWAGMGNTYGYQWQRSSDGNTWTSVTGANVSTYTVGVGDEGEQLRVLITATNADGTAAIASAATPAIPSSPPVNTVAPTISGPAQRGATLTSNQGTWTGIGNAYSQQWQRSPDGTTWTNITGATGAAYTLAISDEGDEVRLNVTATNPDGTASVATQPTNTAQSAAPVNTAAPTLTGTAQRGSVLTASVGTWNGLANNYAYQWQRSSDGTTWTSITGATGASYTVGVADEQATVRVFVTATNADGTASAPSAATTTIPTALPVNTTAPAISGTVHRGSTLTATQGAWNGIANGYADQWQRSTDGTTWTNIALATGTSYILTTADELATVRMLVTATNADGTASAASAATAAVPTSPPVSTAAPMISGTAQRGSALSSTKGSWNGIGNGYAYQWQRSSDGTNWANIAGATNASYTLGVADEGDAVRLDVIATNADGTATASSGVTATVSATPPANTAVPTISGTAQRSVVLTATQGTWSGIGNAYSYQWQHDTGSGFTDIAAATGQTYILGVGDEGTTIRLEVTATNADATVTATTAPTATVTAAPPVNTVVPTISSAATRSSGLTSTQGTWTGIGNSYAYQWQRSPDGSAWNNILGATSANYTLAVADEGDQVRLNVTVSNPDGTVSVPSAPTAVVNGAPPVNTTAPTVTGTAQRGSTLTATQGTWGGVGNSYTYQWQRSPDGSSWSNVLGATASTYTLTAADENESLRVEVSASNADGTVSAGSAQTGLVASAPPVNSSAPTVSGTAARASILTASQGSWSGVGNSYGYQWQSSTDGGGTWSNVAGATGATYTPGVADEGAQLRVLVAATNADGSASVASVASQSVTSTPPVNTAAPTLAGTAQRTAALSASQGTWGGVGNTYAYQWQRSTDNGSSWTPIAGATANSYALVAADENANVRVLVTATNPDGSASMPSPATSAVQPAAPVNTGAPSVSGSPRVSATLTAGNGTWTPSGATFTYDWQRGDPLNGFQDIAGATGSTYTLATADVGETVRVKVTATNVDGATSATSAATGTVAQPPQNVTAPAAPSGTLMDSYTLSPDSGTWDTPGATFSYAWLRCPTSATSVTASCMQVGNAATYTLTTADIGHPIGVAVTADSAGGVSAPANSALTAAVTGRPLTNTAPPSINGDPQPPNTLTANPGSWSVPLTGVSYTWQRCDADGVSNCTQVGTGTSYPLGAADDSHTIILTVTATSPGRGATAQSTALTIQAQPLPQPSIAPTVTGTVQRGSTLTANPGVWTNNPSSITDQWERCDGLGQNCQPVAGATGTTYLLAKSDETFTMTVRVTATNTSGSSSATAQPTVVVAPLLPVNTHVPVLAGVVQQGNAVGVTATAWVATPDTTYATTWERCAADGTGCQPIAGATGGTYTPVAADVGHGLVAVVTATGSDGSVSAVSRAQVVVIAPPRWKTLPTISANSPQVGVSVSITAGVWTGPAVATDNLEIMRCTNVCTPVQQGLSYTISSADIGAILRIRETAANAGGSTVVWSPAYVGPVMSASSASAVLQAGPVVLRNAKGVALAVAQIANAASSAPAHASGDVLGAHAARVATRVVKLSRARGVRGQLIAWVCPVSAKRGEAPLPCTRKVTLTGTAQLKLPAWLTGKVRVVVIRKGKRH